MTQVAVKRAYIAFQTLFNLLLWVPIFYEFQRRVGLSDPEIFAIQSVYYVAFCLLEVPTGFLADRISCRTCMILGAVTLTAANLMPVGLPTYVGFMAHFLAIALARSLISGAASAYLYEYLKQRGEGDAYRKIEGDARFWSLAARIVAGAAAAPLMLWSLTLPYWISAVSAGLALVIALAMPAVAPARETPAADAPLKVGYRSAVFVALRSPRLVLLMLQGVGLFVLSRLLLVNLFQPLLGSRGFAVQAYGPVMGLMMASEAVGSRFAHRIRSVVHDSAAVTLMTLVVSGTLVGIAFGGKAVILVAMAMFSLASGLAFPVQKQLLNDAIPEPRLRATLLSCESIIDRGVCAVAVLPLGGLVARGQFSETLTVAAIGTAAFAVLVHIGIKIIERSGAAVVPVSLS